MGSSEQLVMFFALMWVLGMQTYSLCEISLSYTLVTCAFGSASGKEPACKCQRLKRCWFNPQWGQISQRKKGNLLQYAYLENPMDRAAWQAIVHRVAKSQTQLKQLSTHTAYYEKSLVSKCNSQAQKKVQLMDLYPINQVFPILNNMVHLQKKVAMKPQSRVGSEAEVQAKEGELIQVVVSRNGYFRIQ